MYQITVKREKLLYLDSGNDNIRVLIFYTEEKLKKCSQLYTGGTFKSDSPLFNQFFIIHKKPK